MRLSSSSFCRGRRFSFKKVALLTPLLSFSIITCLMQICLIVYYFTQCPIQGKLSLTNQVNEIKFGGWYPVPCIYYCPNHLYSNPTTERKPLKEHSPFYIFISHSALSRPNDGTASWAGVFTAASVWWQEGGCGLAIRCGKTPAVNGRGG